MLCMYPGCAYLTFDKVLHAERINTAVKLSSTETVVKLLILAGFYVLLTGKYIILIYMLKNEY